MSTAHWARTQRSGHGRIRTEDRLQFQRIQCNHCQRKQGLTQPYSLFHDEHEVRHSTTKRSLHPTWCGRSRSRHLSHPVQHRLHLRMRIMHYYACAFENKMFECTRCRTYASSAVCVNKASNGKTPCYRSPASFTFRLLCFFSVQLDHPSNLCTDPVMLRGALSHPLQYLRAVKRTCTARLRTRDLEAVSHRAMLSTPVTVLLVIPDARGITQTRNYCQRKQGLTQLPRFSFSHG